VAYITQLISIGYLVLVVILLQMSGSSVLESPLNPTCDYPVTDETNCPPRIDNPHSHINTETCAFCAIAHAFPPSAPLLPPTPSPNDNPVIFPQTHIIISTSSVLAFLDIQPLTRGHILVCPRDHVEKVTNMTPSESSRVGGWLPVVARAVMKVAGATDFNIVQNNGICLWFSVNGIEI
jgi:diadenosine tetraphosphate (Ap4A) HIT family hydrolase